ncbi:MAG: hypothetical protein HY037_07325, partial [Nitrospirae bacterium]|nr:hypothetical protein [Candidatus Troglogloeales bacterium]
MKKIAVILLLALSLFGSFFAEAKAPLPCEKGRVCEACDACGAIPLRVAVREALLHDTLSQLKTERKIEQSDLVVSTLLLFAEDALRKGDERSAMDAAEKAISFSSESPLPHFFLSHLYRLNSKESILQALGEYATGIRLSINNFWLFTSFLGMIGLVLFITFHLCLFTFLLYCFTHYMPLWIHYVQERLPV